MDEDRATTGPFAGLRRPEITELVGCLEHVHIHIPQDARSIEDVAAGSVESMRPLREALLSKDPFNLEDSPSKANFTALFWLFYRRSYWRRLWIAQEICFAPKLQLIYGSDGLDFKAVDILAFV